MTEKLVLCGRLIVSGDTITVGGKDFFGEFGKLAEIFNPKVTWPKGYLLAYEDYGDVKITVERIQRKPADQPADFLEKLDRKLAYKKPAKGGPGW